MLSTIFLWLIFISWFVYHDTYLQSAVATFMGILSASTVAYISMKISSNAITRSLLDCKNGRLMGYAGNWISASCIGTGVISFFIFFIVCFEPFNKLMYLGDGENTYRLPSGSDFSIEAMAYDHLDDKEKIQHLYYSELGFALAIATMSVFMRDIPLILGTGLIVGSEMSGNIKGKNDDYEIEVDKTILKTKIIG